MNSKDYGLTISGENTWTRSQLDITKIYVPGRNKIKFIGLYTGKIRITPNWWIV